MPCEVAQRVKVFFLLPPVPSPALQPGRVPQGRRAGPPGHALNKLALRNRPRRRPYAWGLPLPKDHPPPRVASQGQASGWFDLRREDHPSNNSHPALLKRWTGTASRSGSTEDLKASCVQNYQVLMSGKSRSRIVNLQMDLTATGTSAKRNSSGTRAAKRPGWMYWIWMGPERGTPFWSGPAIQF
jgi:hypothetical protein